MQYLDLVQIVVGGAIALTSALITFIATRSRWEMRDGETAGGKGSADDILADLDARNSRLEALLKDERLDIALLRSVALESALYARIKEANDQLAASTEENFTIFGLAKDIWKKSKDGVGYILDKGVDKILGLINASAGLPGPAKRAK